MPSFQAGSYIAAVRRAGGPEPDPSVLEFGLGTVDNPVFAGMHDASALVVGATLAAARAVWTGTAQHGASIAGGLHHAMRASASGFCVYNDPAIAISWLLAAGARRVAYVDIDVHHTHIRLIWCQGVCGRRSSSRAPNRSGVRATALPLRAVVYAGNA